MPKFEYPFDSIVVHLLERGNRGDSDQPACLIFRINTVMTNLSPSHLSLSISKNNYVWIQNYYKNLCSLLVFNAVLVKTDICFKVNLTCLQFQCLFNTKAKINPGLPA